MATGLAALWSLSVFRLSGRHQKKPTYDTPAERVLAVGVVVVAVATPIIARMVGGTAEALSILGLVAGYDAAKYVVGTGAASDWEGPAAGVATVLAGTLAVAALAVPPFTLTTALVLAVIVCVAGPLGPIVARRIAPVARDDEAGAPEEAPAIRRLATMLAAGPFVLVLIGVIHLL